MARYRVFVRDVVAPPTTSEFARREALSTSGSATYWDGGYKPTRADVGELNDPAITMTTINGNVDMLSTQPGRIVENSIINGFVTMQGANQTLRNCVVKGPVTKPPAISGGALVKTFYAGAVNALIQDCTLEMQADNFSYDGVNGHHFTVERTLIRRVTDCVGMVSGNSPSGVSASRVYGSWLEDMAYWLDDASIPGGHVDGTHNDCIQMQNGSDIIVRGTVMRGFLDPTAGDNGGINRQGAPFTTSNSCIQLNNNGGTITNILIENNWVYGGQLGMNGPSPSPETTTGLIIRNNKFDHNQTAPGAGAVGSNTTATINIDALTPATITGNTYEDNGVAVQVRRS